MKSEAQKKANADWEKKTYSPFLVKLKKHETAAINSYCEKFKITRPQFILLACNYFIERGELPPESEVDQIEDYNDNGEL